MPGHRLQTLLEPRSIAMVGASPRPASFGWRSYRALVDGGYEGDIHLVNPRYETIDGRVCADSLRDLKGVEHAVLNVSNTLLEGVLDDAIAAGIPAVTIFASGYLEGDHAPPLLERLRTKTRAAKINVCGGNGTGFKNRDHKVQCTLVTVSTGRRASYAPKRAQPINVCQPAPLVSIPRTLPAKSRGSLNQARCTEV